ncbi:nucleobase/nucleoside transporter [Leptomonas pyrrhocoris]|uniref:Nucleobase/nucleoside transporter n=1 Tax=Leptomonas pyrrhocoris TaxID=157538 RepID=A0A0N0DZN8_LEPPY|nr:nucleobase/nucleoside transporter [Leptomonas pyrrhocoris]KPA85495.1 nucleobase/nucleoside transporter [Leptomonas pyrrhocoris]|eukprot:XP_015663934.1 nucleobase/nucleoside transporter [Leptomonas pyrrhocoris]
MAVTLENILLYTAAAIFGFCCLFAYNSFLSSPSYLEHYFQFAAVKYTNDVSTLPDAKTPSFWNNISTWVTVLMMVPMFLMQFAMLSPWVLRQNVQIRMIIGAFFSLVSVLLVPVTAASGGVSEGSAMAVLIIACLLCGAATTTLESALYAFFGSLPTRYMTGFVMGGGFSGSINSVIRIVITVGLPPTFSGVKTSAVIFFTIGMALMALTIAIVLLLRLSPFVRSYVPDYRRPEDVARCAHTEAAEKLRLHELSLDADNVGTSGAHETPMNAEETMMTTAGIEKTHQDAMADSQGLPEVAVGDNGEPAGSGSDSNRVISPANAEATAAEEEEHQASVIAVIRKIWVMMICLTGNMFTTLVLFPGIGLNAMQVSNKSSSSSSGDEKTWGAEAIMPMIIILMFNVGDTIGRLSINFRTIWVPRFIVPFVVVIRTIVCVIPLALGVCTPKVINSNANPIVVFLVLGITGGYLVGLTMAYGSSDPRLTPKERGIAGACLCFALLVGTTFGSVVSLIVVTQAF